MLRGLCQRAAGVLLQTHRSATERLALHPTTALPSVVNQSYRGTCVFRRMYPVPLNRKSGGRRILRMRNMVYILEKSRTREPAGNMEVLLVEDVEGFGLKGDLMTVTKNVGRNHLLPSGSAVYASEENKARLREEVKDEPERQRLSFWAQKTIRQLAQVQLYIPMSPVHPWTLNKSHVRIAFRKQGIEVKEECLELPDEPITEPQELVINVTVNKQNTVPVSADIFHYYKEDAHILPGFSSEDFVKTHFRS